MTRLGIQPRTLRRVSPTHLGPHPSPHTYLPSPPHPSYTPPSISHPRVRAAHLPAACRHRQIAPACDRAPPCSNTAHDRSAVCASPPGGHSQCHYRRNRHKLHVSHCRSRYRRAPRRRSPRRRPQPLLCPQERRCCCLQLRRRHRDHRVPPRSMHDSLRPRAFKE